MAHKRQGKDERKEVTLEKRVETIEKFVAKLRPDTYNFLTNYIAQQGKTLQQVNAVAMEMRDFLVENGMMEKYQQWLEAKYPQPFPEQGSPKETEPPQSACPHCDGRGYVGDEEECPLCHPNRVDKTENGNGK